MKKIICLGLTLLMLVIASGCETTELSGQQLPTLESQARLKSLLERSWRKGIRLGLGFGAPELDRAEGAGEYSGTNIQVEGVGEADVYVTDGEYLYQATEQGIVISQIWPLEKMKLVKLLDPGFIPSLLYVDESRLIVIGHNFGGSTDDTRSIMPWFSGKTNVAVYNIADIADIRLERELELEGNLVSSRKIGDALYVVSATWVYGPEANPPGFRDSARKDKTKPGYQDIRYFPAGMLDSFVQLAAIDLSKPKQVAQVETILGSAQHIYMSRENLYIAATDWENTFIYRFKAEGALLEYTGSGKVSGVPLNQFSMDEHNGWFRIATTTFQGKLSNSLFVLDDELKIAGQITGIAPGERIYSARFMGDKGYLVTFETVDPLFVIDLSNPKKPKILGELKIPGFSTYLHPLDKDHLLGIGRDTEVRFQYGQEMVIELGLKLAIFDVSDVNNPKERHSISLGGRGTWSEALYDHRAVMFFRGMLAFPVSISDTQDSWGWGAPEFVGAYFYQVDPVAGFSEIGRISHSSGFKGNNQDYWFWQQRDQIRRVVRIEDVVFTASPGEIQAHRADNLKLLKSLKLP